MGSSMKPVVDVSVVVPCYCCVGTIERAVESVALQSCRPLELILVNDASPDQTAECLQRLKECYPEWVVVVNLTANVGAGEARNAGWDRAKGRYVAFLDADDSWHERKLEWQCAYMDLHPEIALTGHAHVIGSAAAEILNFDGKSASISKWDLLISNRFVTPSVMLRREMTQRFRQGRRHMEDHLLWMELACAGQGLARLDAPLVTVHKPLVGVSGLSSHIWSMSQADWGNYGLLFRSGFLRLHELALIWVWVTLKFTRRMAGIIWSRLLRLSSGR
jgi:glycosyltransferase involved in cell wall biosynthesis